MSFNHPVESTTLYQYPSTTQYYSSYTTDYYAELQKRATSSSESGSSSSSKHSTTSSCTDKQRCQTGSSMSGGTIALAVSIPTVVFLAVIGVFMFRSYRKGKKEAESDDDPEFYGETTILPDYPGTRLNDFKPGPSGNGGDFDKKSYYSNPFAGENARYPSRVLQGPTRTATQDSFVRSQSNDTYDRSGIDDPYYHNFSLPQQHQLGSSHSLHDLAKHIGSDYSAYPIDSRPTSKAPSRVGSPYRSPNSSDLNVSQTNKNVRNLTEKTISNDDPTTDSSTSYRETKTNEQPRQNTRDFHNAHDDSDDEPEDVFQDSYAEPTNTSYYKKSPTKDSHNRQNSDVSFLEDEPEVLRSTRSPEPRQVLPDDELEDVAKNDPRTIVASNNEDRGNETEEDDEDIKRMKSVYRVYFDRDDSVRKAPSPQKETEVAPPLPTIPTADVEERGNYTEEEEEESSDQFDTSVIRHAHQDSLQLPTPTTTDSDHLSPGEDSSKPRHHNRAVSSIYSTIPLNFNNAPELPHNQLYEYNQSHPEQQYPVGHQVQYPEQYPQQYPQQYDQQYQQQYPQQYQKTPPTPQSPYTYQNPRSFQSPRAQHPSEPLKPLQQLPNPSKLDDPVTNTDYAPTRSLTAGTRPADLTIKPFNPIHYADQVFQPTSPTTASSGQFPNQPPNQSSRDGSTPSPHHIRQSVVMFNPVEIGKQKIYRPAGSFSQLNSANSSRNGSLTSQSAYQDPNSSRAELLPTSGSQSDLRKQLGSHEDYNIAP